MVLLGLTAMFIFGVHGMLSGTASMDFGGRKAAATVAGALDGIQYVGSGLTGFGLGWVLKTYGWDGVAAAGHHARPCLGLGGLHHPLQPDRRLHHDPHLERQAVRRASLTAFLDTVRGVP